METFMPYSLHKSKNKKIRLISEFWANGLDPEYDEDFLHGQNKDCIKIFLREMESEFLEHLRRNYEEDTTCIY